MTDHLQLNDYMVMRASANRILTVSREMAGETKRLREGARLRDINLEAATILKLCDAAIKQAGGQNS